MTKEWYASDTHLETISSTISDVDRSIVESIPKPKISGYFYAKLKEKAIHQAGPPIRMGTATRFFLLLWTLLLVVMANVVGGFMFYYLESRDSPSVIDRDSCIIQLEQQIKQQNLSANTVLFRMEMCLKTRSEINTPLSGILFAWSLYTTVGYGNTYPHTFWGRMLAIPFSLMTVPLFMILKVEFGRVASFGVLKLAHFFWHFFPGSPSPNKEPRQRPSDGLLAFTILLLVVVFLTLVSLLIINLEDMNWFSAFFFTFISVYLIGLGDLVPSLAWFTFVIVLPTFLLGDALTSYLNYYIHARTRLWIIPAAQAAGSLIEKSPSNEENGEVCDFPNVTTTGMPMNLTAEERSTSSASNTHSFDSGSL